MTAAAELNRLAAALAPSLVPRLEAEAVIAAHPEIAARFKAHERDRRRLAERHDALWAREKRLSECCRIVGKAVDRLRAAEETGFRPRVKAALAGLDRALADLEKATRP